MATMEEILANADTGRYSTNQNTNLGNNTFGSNRGPNTNYGVVNAPMYLNNPEEEFNAGTMYTTNPESSFTNASVLPNSSAPGFDNRFSGIMRNTVARPLMFQGGVQAGMGLSKALGITNPFLALAGGIGSQFLNLSNRPSNLDYDYVNQPGGISVVDNKVRGGVLEGKNFASGFGSNDLGQMYQNYIDKMEGRGMVTDEFGNLVFEEDELTKAQNQKLKDARAELRAYLTTGRKMPGYETPDGKRMTAREFAFNYNQGIGQFAMPTTDSTGKTLDYTGESDTYAGGESTDSMGNTSYDDPYDPGGGE
jgi:hypothetical protein